MDLPFFNNYFLENNILHSPGKCINEKAWVLPINISSDYKETKCNLKTENMEWKPEGVLIKNINNISFCKNCKDGK